MPNKKQEVTNLEIYQALNELRKELVARDELLEDKVDRTYLRIQVFESEVQPLKKFVYGLIAVVGGVFITALMALLLKGA